MDDNKTDKAFGKIKKQAEEKEEFKYIASKVLPDGTIIEMLLDKDSGTSSFAIGKEEEIKVVDMFIHNGVSYKPHSPDKSMFKNNVVLFPSIPLDYGSKEELIKEIQKFIHKYLSVSDFFEKIATYYVLFSYIYDDFSELPYLRGLGDYGTGKSRLLKVVGSICYRPMFTGGATTTAPTFRLLDEYNGTLIFDEADLKMSDTTADMIKILNCGFMKGVAVLRCEPNKKKGFDIKSFDVFGPKLIATRKLFDDSALESRMITEDMSLIERRKDIPYNVPESFDDEALILRNKLLMFRFMQKGKNKLKLELGNSKIEARLNQISLPLMSIINDLKVIAELKGYLEDYNEKLKNDRTLNYNYQIIDAICKLYDIDIFQPTIAEIALRYNDGQDISDKVTPKKMGYLINKVLNLKTVKKMNGFVLSLENKAKIEKLRKRFEIKNINEEEAENELPEQQEQEKKQDNLSI